MYHCLQALWLCELVTLSCFHLVKRPLPASDEPLPHFLPAAGRPTGFSDAPAGYTPAPTGFSDGPPGGMPYQAPEQTQQFDEVTRKVQIPNAKVSD